MKNKCDDQEFKKIVSTHTSASSCLKTLGLKQAGGNYYSFKRRVKDLGLDISHFKGPGWSKGLSLGSKRPLSEYLILNEPYKSNIQSGQLRLRLISEGIKSKRCERCTLESWQDEPVPLELHHMNGNHDDNRIENLQILCPNCHALTKNYRGKNSPFAKIKSSPIVKEKTYCLKCNKEIRKNKSSMCMQCFKISTRKVERPSKEALIDLIDKYNYSIVGRMYGVSDNAIRKWLK